MLTISARACASILKINAKKLMSYDSPLNCSTGITSSITIEDNIVDSNITSCQNHYVLVKDSNGRNYCGMYIHVL